MNAIRDSRHAGMRSLLLFARADKLADGYKPLKAYLHLLTNKDGVLHFDRLDRLKGDIVHRLFGLRIAYCLPGKKEYIARAKLNP